MVVGDAVLATASMHQLDLIQTDQWSMVAAHLVALGLEGEDLITLAGLPAPVSAYEVHMLVPRAMAEIAPPSADVHDAIEVLIRLLTMVPRGEDHPLMRSLALVHSHLDYPVGVVAEAEVQVEYLDYLGGSRADADAFEAGLRARQPLRLPQAMAEALVGELGSGRTPTPADRAGAGVNPRGTLWGRLVERSAGCWSRWRRR